MRNLANRVRTLIDDGLNLRFRTRAGAHLGLAVIGLLAAGPAFANDVVDRAVRNAANINLAVQECGARLTPEGDRIVSAVRKTWPDEVDGAMIETTVLAVIALKGAAKPVTITTVRELICKTLRQTFDGPGARDFVAFDRRAP